MQPALLTLMRVPLSLCSVLILSFAYAWSLQESKFAQHVSPAALSFKQKNTMETLSKDHEPSV